MKIVLLLLTFRLRKQEILRLSINFLGYIILSTSSRIYPLRKDPTPLFRWFMKPTLELEILLLAVLVSFQS
ncbi:hypothetical protein NC653_017475 [Populus alba x Populus x berolinensis]|uniref:Uncharacterized protein n=1 Tax=Populus alba x Populus x berolinensis TaxID=444605 RepID=A0AAD6W0K2_9ROSI|nr:hypothetical protein NC653_017475 [Populus alba x Populus x berolinensis]